MVDKTKIAEAVKLIFGDAEPISVQIQDVEWRVGDRTTKGQRITLNSGIPVVPEGGRVDCFHSHVHEQFYVNVDEAK